MTGPSFGLRIRTQLPSIGCCAYCWEQSSDLTTEHIIPRSLGGRIEFLKSSCERCRKITQKFEEDCARKTFFQYRVRAGYPASAPKEWPKTFKFPKLMPDGSQQLVDMPSNKIPRILMMLEFPVAGILRDRPPNAGVQTRPWFSTNRQDHSALAGTETETTFHTLSFCRMIAKIAHSYAVATIDPSCFPNFRFLLCELIRTGEVNPFHVVGGDSKIPSVATNQPHHWIDLVLTSHGERRFLAAKIRLFAYRGAPVYHGVVAELVNPALPIVSSAAALKELGQKTDKTRDHG